jgi:copper chaperone CopZ
MIGLLGLSAPVLACPMSDKADYEEALKEVQTAEGTKVTFEVVGMTCGGCTAKVTDALKKIDGVRAAAVDYQTGRAEIAYNEAKTTSDALLEVIRSTGFKAEKAKSDG